MTDRLMTKDGLKPYFALHRDIAGRVDLQPADKLTWAALVDFLPRTAANAGAYWIAPPVRFLARKTALSARQVHRSLRRLEAAGLIQRRERIGRPACYAVLEPPPLEPDATGVNPGHPVRGTPDKMAGPPGHPVTPGGCHPVTPSHVTPSGQRAARRRGGRDLTPRNLLEVSALERLRETFEAVTGESPHAGWIAAALDDCQHGNAATWLTLDADRLAAARRRSSEKFPFGPWAVRAEHMARAEKQQVAEKQRRRAEGQAQTEAEAAAATEEQRRQQHAAFDALTDAQRDAYRQAAAEKCTLVPASCRADVIETTARFIAWQHQSEGDPHPGQGQA